LVQTQDGAAPDVAGALADVPGVLLAEQTAGAYDVVARVDDAGPHVPSAKRVVQVALRVPGVTLAVCCHDHEADGSYAVEPAALDLTEPRSGFPPSPQIGLATL
jgi:hypothetical protein